MPDPLTVTPAELTAAATAATGIAAVLRGAIALAGATIDVADVPAAGWLALAATHRVVAVATAQLDAIARDLATTGAALRTAALAYQETDDRAARRYASGPLDPATTGPRAMPW
jgi:hypothetical protein